MAAVDDLDEVLKLFHLVQGEFAKGNPDPCKTFFSMGEDVTLNNPLFPPVRGSRSLRLRTVAHRLSEMASSLGPRSYRNT